MNPTASRTCTTLPGRQYPHGQAPKLRVPNIPSYKRQKGATALEFSLVFPALFAVFYGVLMYGMIFLTQMSLQHAAADGARAALRFLDTVTNPTADEDDTPQTLALKRRQALLQARIDAAKAVSETQAAWMSGWAQPIVEAAICQAGVECDPASATGTPDCSALTTTCQIVVSVTYPYRDSPIIPALPGFGLMAPTQLQGSARTLFNGKTLSTL